MFEDEKVSGIQFGVRGTPRPQPRPRFVDGRVVSTAGKAVKFWKGQVQNAVKAALGNLGGAKEVRRMFVGGPLAVDMLFRFATDDLTRVGKPHWEEKPDFDNLAKLPVDVCAKLEMLAGDDCKIADCRVRKFWCRPGNEGLSLRLERCESVLEDEIAAEPLWIGA